MNDYEITWDDKKIIPAFKQLVCEKLGGEAWDALIKDICVPEPDTEGECGCCNMRVIIKRLEEMADTETVKGILTRVRHGFTREQFGDFKKELNECGNNIDSFLEHSRKQKKEEFLRHHAEGTTYWGDLITDEALDFLINTEGVLSAVRKGSELHISRHPYDMTNYFNETDERRRRFHFCHCLFARTSILNDEGAVSRTMCYCSLGFAKAQWENTFDVELDGEVVKSVLGGDGICSFIIYLPDDIIEKYT
ncbi:MAG: DUF6144 family protein [Defluviitaleaceae bacterium]|nr:DUF6144 family protein [Defluviitaleaceae bacterium]